MRVYCMLYYKPEDASFLLVSAASGLRHKGTKGGMGLGETERERGKESEIQKGDRKTTRNQTTSSLFETKGVTTAIIIQEFRDFD